LVVVVVFLYTFCAKLVISIWRQALKWVVCVPEY